MSYVKSRKHRIGPKALVGILIGVICGFFLTTWSRHFCDVHAEWCCLGRPRIKHIKSSETIPNAHTKSRQSSQKNLIFIGVMTAKKYIDTRALAAYRTWAKTIPGKVVFFSSAGSTSEKGVPVVGLPGVDDSYPPQKKSFMMLKYIHDHYINKFEWFMRADDDVYIKGKRLANFLHSVNSSRPQFIGQAGLGNKEEFGLLSLDHNENFCMGGPGMVLSKQTLQRVVPHISYCLKNLYTTHEDVEVGRCVRKFAQTSCTWAFEMQRLFYQNYREDNWSFMGKLKTKDIHQAITLHAIKQPPYMYRLHNYLQGHKTSDLRHKLLLLRREIHSMNVLVETEMESGSVKRMSNRYGIPPSLHKFVPESRDEVQPWEFLSRSLYSHNSLNPKRALHGSLKEGLEDILMQVMQMINKNARQRGRTIDFKEILYGYRRVNPLHGADYILDLLLMYRKHKGRKMTVPVRRHAYLQQTFTDVEFTEDENHQLEQPKITLPTNAFTALPSKAMTNIFDFLKQKLGLGYFQITGKKSQYQSEKSKQEIIHTILPLAGRFETFKQFIKNFEKVCLMTNEEVKLAVILFKSESESESTNNIENLLVNLRIKYPKHELQLVNATGSFSRAIALDVGAALYGPSALLFFVDVDMIFHQDVLHRIRQNTHLGQQVYYPIVYSQYDPAVVCANRTCPESAFVLTESRGYWRQFGYGIVSMYNADLRKVGGFDTSIHGWGKEDVDLYNKFVASNLTIFRSVDPGLVHIFHSIHCDPQLESSQYQMCLGSMGSSYAPVETLAHIVFNNENILHRNENNTSSVHSNNSIEHIEDLEFIPKNRAKRSIGKNKKKISKVKRKKK